MRLRALYVLDDLDPRDAAIRGGQGPAAGGKRPQGTDVHGTAVPD